MNEIAAFADRLCLTLLHSLWQATAMVLLVSAVVRLSRCRARIAYAAWMTGLLSAVVCMPVTFLRIPPGIAQQRTPAFDSAEAVVPTPDASGNITAETASRAVPVAAHWRPDATEKTPAAEILAAANTVPQDSDRQPVEPASSGLSVSASAGLWVLAVYLPGVVLMLLRLCLASVSAGRLARNASIQQDNRVDQIVQSIARQWNLRISPVVAVTQQVIVPHVVGLFRPVILLPASAVTGLSADELTLVLAHEIAHVRRFDLWATMVQRLAEALLFFNPAVWLLSRRVSEFREFCCDDLVCQSAADSQTRIRVRYAEALLHVVSLSSAGRTDAPNLTAVAASGRSPSELRRRIARLLNEPVSEPVPGGRGLLVAFGACLLCLTLPVMMPRDVATGAGSAASLGGEKPVGKPGQREFRLQVTGPDGKPLPHVHCEIRGIPKIPTADVLVGRHEKDHRYGTILEADESGQLHFWRPVDAQYLNVFVELPGYGPYLAAWRVADGSEGIPDSFTIELEAAWTVTGQVVDAAGKPIAGAQVSPEVQFRRRPGDEEEIGTGTHLTTDASGFWRYEMVPVSEETVFVSIDDPRYAQSRLRLPRAEYEAKPDGAPKTIVLVTGLSVTGTVTDEIGKPVEDALIRTMYFNELREAKTDQNGKYTLRGCEPRLTRIVCSAPGRARDLQDVQIDPAMAPVNFTMRPGRHVRIRVLDENGAGVARSRIYFQRWRGPIRYFEFNGVDQYADGQGVWEWNEAPLDEFQADICRADGMVLEYQQIKPGIEEYVFRPPGLLVVSGRVTDKETGELVRNFRCVPGGRDEPGQREGENWHLQDTYQAIDGTYSITRHRSAPAHLVRIEADGYKIAVSRDIRDSEGNLELNFELTRTPDIAISFSTPDGQPASEAEVVIGLANEQIVIRNGEFTLQTYATRMKTDKAGVLRMPFRDQPFEVYVLHPGGFAHARSAEGTIPEQVTLTAWASVNGTIYSGNKPAANAPVSLYSDGSFVSELCSVLCSCVSQADGNGAFTMPQVFPGTGRIGRDIIYMDDDGATEVTSSRKLTATWLAGQTTSLEIGRGGRPVIGRLVLPRDSQRIIGWGHLRLELNPDLPQPPPRPARPVSVRNDPQALARWQQTPAVRAYEAAQAAWQAQMAKLPVFDASVDRDGRFRINNVPSGRFVLSEHLMKPRSFEIPDFDGDYEEAPLDLGDIELVQE